jgi:error-prone DNA polymerase
MLNRSDAPISDILDSARKLRPLDKRHVERRNSEAFLKSSEEMAALADEISRSAGERSGRALLKSTHELAMRSILSPKKDFGLGGIYLPEPEVVGANSAEQLRSLLQERSEAGLHWRYSSSKTLAVARDRLADELTTVATLGYESYFLTVADIAQMARDRGIRVAARGSGAGQSMYKTLEAWAQENDAAALFMIALDDDRVEKTSKFYARAGFKPMERTFVKGADTWR